MADASVYSKSIHGSILFAFQLEERQKEWEREYVVMAWREFKVMFIVRIQSLMW